MTDIMRQRLRRSYPAPPQKFKSLDEVAEWANRLYRALAESMSEGFGGNIIQSSNPPGQTDGQDTDIWIEIRS